jgi:hypothetical protein
VLNIALNRVINTEADNPWYPKKDARLLNVMCSGGQSPTTMPTIGDNEIKDTSNHPHESAIFRIRANGATRRIDAAMRPQ